MTKTQLKYWFSKTARPIAGQKPEQVSIHAVINSKVDNLPDNKHHCTNTLSLLRFRIQRGCSLTDALIGLTDCSADPRRRARVIKWRGRLGYIFKL